MEKDRSKWHSQPKSTWYSKISALSFCVYQGEDNDFRGLLGHREPSSWAVGHTQSRQLTLMNEIFDMKLGT